MTRDQIKPPSPGRQIAFHQLLVAARKSWLVDALKEALGVADPNAVKEQISKCVPADVQKILAANGIRDELVFPVPALLEAKPTLIGYYRLLLGVPQKSFYRGGTGMGQFKAMEIGGLLKPSKTPRPRRVLRSDGKEPGRSGAPDGTADLKTGCHGTAALGAWFAVPGRQ